MDAEERVGDDPGFHSIGGVSHLDCPGSKEMGRFLISSPSSLRLQRSA